MTYFMNHDVGMHDRQSDGVQFCILPNVDDSKIYFYCAQYCMFWDAIEDVGKFEKAQDLQPKKRKINMRPATLSEIHRAQLCGHIHSIKECVIVNNKVVSTQRIEFPT
jgi:hypothetical protein